MELDWSVGEIFRALRQHALEENTIVIFTSDNGPWLAYGNHAGSAKPLREGKELYGKAAYASPLSCNGKGICQPAPSSMNPLMTIDLLPTIARITGANLPSLPIDGRDAWPLLTRQPGAQTPHEAYYFYYQTNELQAVRSGPWKLYFPHTYNTPVDSLPGRDGLPGQSVKVKIQTPELYNLENDISEIHNVAGKHPEIVQRLNALAELAREELGDALTGRDGRGVRPAGKASFDF
jgi:arylsulfatase A